MTFNFCASIFELSRFPRKQTCRNSSNCTFTNRRMSHFAVQNSLHCCVLVADDFHCCMFLSYSCVCLCFWAYNETCTQFSAVTLSILQRTALSYDSPVIPNRNTAYFQFVLNVHWTSIFSKIYNSIWAQNRFPERCHVNAAVLIGLKSYAREKLDLVETYHTAALKSVHPT
jgi:hypothetical protein